MGFVLHYMTSLSLVK